MTRIGQLLIRVIRANPRLQKSFGLEVNGIPLAKSWTLNLRGE